MPGPSENLLERSRRVVDTTAPRTNETADAARSPREGLRGMSFQQGESALKPPVPPPPQQRTLQLPKGRTYVLKAADVQGDADQTWQYVAEQNGSIDWRVKQANEGIVPAEGVSIYLPSTEEMLFADCLKATGDQQKAAEKYAQISTAGGLAVLKGAREAASGDSGESYGTAGKNGVFYASNPGLAGASSKRTVTENGKTLYKIAWASDFWKCNLFANESVYRGGFQPSMQANKHYTTAGSLYKDTKTFQEVAASAAYAGLVTVFQGGGGSNESHTGVLGSMPILTTDEDGNTVVSFTFIGASSDRAKEADKQVTLKKGTNDIVAGDSHAKLRFLKPLKKR